LPHLMVFLRARTHAFLAKRILFLLWSRHIDRLYHHPRRQVVCSYSLLLANKLVVQVFFSWRNWQKPGLVLELESRPYHTIVIQELRVFVCRMVLQISWALFVGQVYMLLCWDLWQLKFIQGISKLLFFQVKGFPLQLEIISLFLR